MPLDLASPAIDAGIVARDASAMLSFYRDLLGLEQETAIEMPGGGGYDLGTSNNQYGWMA